MNKRGEMNYVRRNKKAQMQLSFGMIFSIILIVIFIVFAVYGINKFLEVQRYAQVKSFQADLQKDIDTMFAATDGARSLEYSVPKNIKQVCIIPDRKNALTGKSENIYYTPDKTYSAFLLKNVDTTKTVLGLTGRKLCIDNVKGRVSMTLKKVYGSPQVIITK